MPWLAAVVVVVMVRGVSMYDFHDRDGILPSKEGSMIIYGR